MALSQEIKTLLGDELAGQVETKLGETNIVIDDGKMIPKSRFDEVNQRAKTAEEQLTQQKTEYETQIGNINKELNTLKDSSKLTEEEKKKIVDLTNENERLKVESDKKLTEQKKTNAIDIALINSGARNIAAVKANLDLTKVSIDGENLVGLNEQVESLKKEHDYLFGEVKKVGQPPVDNSHNPAPISDLQKSLNEVQEQHAKNPTTQTGATIIALQRQIRNQNKQGVT